MVPYNQLLPCTWNYDIIDQTMVFRNDYNRPPLSPDLDEP